MLQCRAPTSISVAVWITEMICGSVDHRGVYVAVWITEVHMLQCRAPTSISVAVWNTEDCDLKKKIIH